MSLAWAKGQLAQTVVPETWKIGEATLTLVTAGTAAAAALFTSDTVRGEYLGQYATGGVLAGGIVVAVLLAMAPPVFAFLATQGNGTPVDRRRRAFAGASVLTLTAALAQTGLVVLMLLSGSVASTGLARACICAAGLVVAALVVSTPITALKQIGVARESASI